MKNDRLPSAPAGASDPVGPLAGRPIRFVYPRPSAELLSSLAQLASPAELAAGPGLQVLNIYFQAGLPATRPRVYLRQLLVTRLREALTTLPADYGLAIYDGFRARATQTALYRSFQAELRARNPEWREDELIAATRKFVANPDDPARLYPPPHNTGGAVDLTLTYRGQTVEMGTPFDALTAEAATDFFERPWAAGHGFSAEAWDGIRARRRILFNALIDAGFTNWRHEWWHYDLGNGPWAELLKAPRAFDSMEALLGSERCDA